MGRIVQIISSFCSWRIILLLNLFFIVNFIINKIVTIILIKIIISKLLNIIILIILIELGFWKFKFIHDMIFIE